VLLLEKHGLEIALVVEGSIGDELGLQIGDKILAIDGVPLRDLIDYKYLISDEEIYLEVQSKDGVIWDAEVEKEFDEDLGLSFESYTSDGIKRCGNKCVFCFVDQMAPDLRPSLYVKDDDYRWSFLQGNFVTLTNLKEEDLERIIKTRLSPLYISVHTTNPELRAKMLNNQKAKDILNILGRFQEADLEVHTQVVLCPEVNDGVELDRTINDLKALWPNVASLAIVPVGLTKFREGLFNLRKFTSNEAIKVIRQVEEFQKQCRKELDNTFVYLSDEFYLLGDEQIPQREFYHDFPQTENGVGLVRLFMDEYAEIEANLPAQLRPSSHEARKVTLATGVSGGKVLEPIVQKLNKIQGLQVNLEVIPNHFFGTDVTVTGLLTCSDLIRELKGKDLGQALIIPKVMLKSGEKIFLDNLALDHLERELSIEVLVVEDTAYDMVNKILEMEVAANE
jgi:putative radical SAM enzyme (TIGR03279 family)